MGNRWEPAVECRDVATSVATSPVPETVVGREDLAGSLTPLSLLSPQSPLSTQSPSPLSPLSHGQRSLWFLHHLAPVGGAYNISAAARVRGPLDPGALEGAFQALVDRHPALRTTFPAVDGTPYQRVAAHQDLTLSREDVTGWSAAGLRSRLAQEAWRSFDLERGPLLRVSLLTGDPGGPVILLSIHHIVADFWSLAILVRELAACYREAAGGGTAQLPPPGLAYGEHVRLEAEALAAEQGEAMLAYWRQKLAGLPALELALDRPRPAVQTYRGDCHRFRLPGELTAALRARGRERHGTLFMTLVAAFQTLLCRHTRQEDLAIGAPRAGRSQSKFARTVGYFVNPVVLRGDLAGDPTFATLLERTKTTVLAAFEHGDVPVALLAERLETVRDPSRTPLFQVSFVLQKETRGVEGLAAFALGEEGVEIGPEELRLVSLSLERPPVPFELMLQAVERQGTLSFALQYNADLFDAATAVRLQQRFATLLEAIAGSPDLALSALPILPEAERSQLLCGWNDTAGAGSESTLFARFAAQAERSRDEVAVVFEEERLTYRELAGRAEALARQLARLGVGPESLVAVAAERSIGLVVGLLGVLGAGGAYLPLEPSLPRQRLATILEHARPAVLLTHRRHAGALPLDAVPGTAVAWLDDGAGPPGEEPPLDLLSAPPGPPLARPLADNAAYVIYTSGSTGRPKGVVNSHRGILNRLLWMVEAFGLEAGDRFLQKTPFGFDVSVPELFAPLLVGGRLVLARPEGHRDAAYLARLVQREAITTIHFVPSMLPHFLAAEGAAACCRSLRRVLVSGEALPWETEQRCLEALAVPLYNLYGPTEAAVEVTAWACRPAARPGPVPIGRPVRNTRLHVVGRRLELVPAGAIGELAIGGVQVARGYLGRPDLTAEAFVPDPFAAASAGEAGARLYRTGDLCRHLPGGELEYLGRLDDQVKIRGHRVEPREIEVVLATHPEVREAAVVLRQDHAGERSLLACVVQRQARHDSPGATGETAATVAGWRDFLAARLPLYMVPAFALGEDLDRLPNGKLDRRSLARWTPLAETARAGGAPRTPLEELLAGIFADVLGVERIGVDDSFFAHGGHSLSAMRLLARVRERLGADLPLHRVFELPTVAALAAAIGGAAQAEAPILAGASGGIGDTGRPREAELSFAQERLWFLQQLEPGSAAFNMPLAVELSGALHRGAFSAALAEIVRRHESLRTTFPASGGAPRQRIAPPAPGGAALPLVDLSTLPAERGPAAAERLEREHAGEALDLERGPLLRALLVRLSAERHHFCLNLHHIVADGWSLLVLMRELGALYGTCREGRPSPLPELPIQYADFAVWQRRALAAKQAEQLAYWETRLGGERAAAEFPADRPRPPVQAFRGKRRRLVLAAGLTARLGRFGREQGVTLFMTLLAATQALLYRHSGEHDVPVGAPIAVRPRVETEGLIGCFLNTLVLRTDLSGRPSFRQLAARVRTITLEAYTHQDVPFEAVLARLRLDRDLSRTPLFQVLLNMLNLPLADLSLPGLGLSVLAPVEVPSKFDMTFYVAADEASVGIDLVYNADLFDEARIDGLLAQLEQLLEQAVERPDDEIDSLSLVSAAMRPLLPDPAAALDGSWIGGVHELFAAQAERAPERTAVVDGGVVWSYGDLLAGSRRLAGWLAAEGVCPGDAVAILAHRSAPLVQAVLGTLTAGAAFMVLDPAYPVARLVEMLRLARPRALIALQAAGPVPEAAGSWLREAECACLELPGGGAAALESLAAFAAVPRVSVGPRDVACYGFTSGSTGGPKGIVGLHGPLSHFLPAHCREFDLGPDDRFALLSGLSHDPLQRDIFTPLYLGAAIVVPDPADIGSAGRGAAWMKRERVTVAHLTPALAQLLTERPPGGEVIPVPSLRRVFLVGEALTRQDVVRLQAMAPGVSCINLYGSTETQRAVAFHRVTPAEAEAVSERATQVLPLGHGVQDVQLLVINRAGSLAGLGELGEIAVRSPHLARGYLDNDELTAERFQVNPFTGEAGDRIYRTGDLGRYLPDGEVAFAGRSDFQVKLRGFRIELGEIEALLASHPAVREAAVLLRGDLPGGSGLVAYVAAGEPGEDTARPLRGWLEARLPGYMVPTVFVHLGSLPRTPTGKVDRRALERIAPAMERAAEKDAPLTPAEELLAGIWAQVLGLERVGAEEDFFELGGHSLLATQVTSRIEEVFGVAMPLRRFFAAPTVAGLAAELEQLSSAAGSPPLERMDREGGIPLSFAQQRLWFLDRLEPGSPVYNLPVALRLLGNLSVAALRSSLGEVVRRHEALRTTFDAAGDEPLQRVSAPAAVPMPVIDLGGLADREGELSRLSRAHAERPFDLARGPLLRASLVRVGATEHAALLNQHHAVSDGWSVGVLVREMVALYGAFAAGRPSPLPELAIQYPDFALWQRRWLSGEALERQVGYWRGRLAGLPALLDLPADRPRPALRSHRGSRCAFQLPVESWRRLQDLGRREGVTDFMTLLALFQAALSRLSGEEDLAVGTVVANRRRAELEPLIGFFANTLVMRGDLSGRPSVRGVLLRTRESALEAYAHQDLPFEQLVEALQPVRDASSTPLFQVMLVLQNVPRQALSLPGLDATPITGSRRTGGARFDLTLDLAETPRGLTGWLEYATDLFDAATIYRLAEHLASLLAAAGGLPSSPVSELPLLAAGERHQLLREWNDTETGRAARAAGRTGADSEEKRRDAGCLCRTAVRIHQLFEWQAARRPDAVAVAGQGLVLTYAELDARANRLARHLRRLGVGPEAPVGLCVERSPEMVVALLGILKAGGAYVPLDPAHPVERLALVLGDSELAALVTEEPWLQRLRRSAAGGGAAGCRVVCLDRDRERIGAEAATALGGRASGGRPESLAYLIYTSGSTGRPKGVCLSHGAVVNFLTAMADRLGLRAGAVLPALTTLMFDIAGLEIWLPLAVGGRVEVVGREEAADGRRLAARLAASGATALQATPATWRLLLDSGWAGQPGLAALCGGEALPRELASALQGRGVELWNLYGPTETAIWSAAGRVEAAVADDGGAVTLGRPLANTRLYVVDRGLELVPPGTAGELLIGGAGVARGYWRRPELTAERFMPDPWSAAGGGRLYRTGDLVRHRADGELDFLGRIDHQVKLRGFRIELGEVEAALAAYPGVAAAVVLARHDARTGAARLVAYLVAEPVPPPRELRPFLAARLPDYMVPAAFVTLAALPLTPNGKVDRRALPAPEELPGTADGEVGTAAPRTAVEELTAGIWEEVLGLDRPARQAGGGRRIGVHEDFFDLGGHSLLATRVMSRLRQTFGTELPLRALFEEPTVAGLALRVEAALRADTGVPLPPLRPVGRAGRAAHGCRLPLSFAQQRLWFLDRLTPDSPAYNIPAACELSGPLAPAALAASLGEVVRRHEALRTRFAAADGEPWQEIEAPGPVALPLVDLGGLAQALAGRRPGAVREELQRLEREEVSRPFDLARGPLLRARLVRLGPEREASPTAGLPEPRHVLLLNLHHIVSDGWSQGLLQAEIAAIYAAAVERRPSPLAALPVQYADFAAWQRAWPAAVLESQLAYWRRQLAGAPMALELPADETRPAVQSYRGGRRELRLPAALAAELRRAARREGATLYMVLLAGFAALLARHSGQQDLLIGTPVANRTRPEIEGLIGVFVNTLVLRARVDGDPPFRQLLANAREAALGAFAHQDLPFEVLVEELGPERDLARNPLIQVLLALQTAGRTAAQGAGSPVSGAAATAAGVRFTPRRLAAGTTAKFDLALAVDEVGEEGTGPALSLALEYATDLFGAATAARLLGHYATLLAQAVAEPALRLSQLSHWSAAERHQVLVEWNDTASGAPRRAIHRLFEEQAAARPEAVAVVWEGGQLTYGELDRRADRLARALRRLGVRPEGRVGLCVERSGAMVEAMLGILKAGGAYLPLDAAHPRERLAFQIEDAELQAIVGWRHLLASLPGTTPRLELEEIPAVAGRDPRQDPTSGRDPDGLEASGFAPESLAYVLYTSGSTGTPKGVEVGHQAVVRLVRGQGYAALGPDEVFLQLAPMSFDAATFEVWAPLLNGGRLALFPPRPFSLAELYEAVDRHRVTTLWLTAGLFHLAVEEGLTGLGGLRQLLAGGDALSPSHVERALAALPEVDLINGYGPTENTTFSCCQSLRGGIGGRPVPIGRPIGGSQAYVLDRDLQPLPVGCPGELFAGGAGVARGYLRRPELTAERFVPDPFGDGAPPPGAGRVPGGRRLYRTGDLVRWRPEGTLEFLGRRDRQVKVRGFRVEPGEVESVLLRHPRVREAVVAAPAEAGQDRRLVAYYVTAPDAPAAVRGAPAGDEGGEVTAAELRSFLRERLPEHLVPAAFMALPSLPLTANGKLDRRALPAPPAPAGTADGGGGPLSPSEEIVAAIWSELLGVARAGRLDNFFDLGGHSLLATQLVSRLRSCFGVELPLRRVFESPTLGELAAHVESRRSNGSDRGTPRRLPRPARLPLSHAQERLWFLYRLDPRSAAFNIGGAVRLAGSLDVAALAAGVGGIVRRHEILRTSFHDLDGEPVQAISPPLPTTLPVVDLGALAEPRRERELQRLAAGEARRPFDLAHGGLLRARLLRLGERLHVALLAMHHIVGDGWSMAVLQRELGDLYEAFSRRRPSPLPDLHLQYADYALWQRRWLAGEEQERQLAYWRRQLRGPLPVLLLPMRRERPSTPSLVGATRQLRSTRQCAAALDDLGRREGATLFMTLLAAFDALLYCYTGQEDVLVGTNVANRNRGEIEGLIGYFANNLALRTDLSANPTFRELLRRVRSVALDAYAHQDVPFEQVIADLQPRRDGAYAPLFQVMLVLQNYPAAARQVPGLELAPLQLPNQTANFELILSLSEGRDGLTGRLTYDADLFDASTMTRLASDFEALLEQVAASPDLRLSSLAVGVEPAESVMAGSFNESL